MSDYYLQCTDCGKYVLESNVKRGRQYDWLGRVHTYRYCADCGCNELEEVPPGVTVCDGCQDAEALPGDDLCAACQPQTIHVDPITTYPVPFESVLLRRVG